MDEWGHTRCTVQYKSQIQDGRVMFSQCRSINSFNLNAAPLLLLGRGFTTAAVHDDKDPTIFTGWAWGAGGSLSHYHWWLYSLFHGPNCFQQHSPLVSCWGSVKQSRADMRRDAFTEPRTVAVIIKPSDLAVQCSRYLTGVTTGSVTHFIESACTKDRHDSPVMAWYGATFFNGFKFYKFSEYCGVLWLQNTVECRNTVVQYNMILYIIAATEAEYQSEAEPTKYTPYLTGEVWVVFLMNILEKYDRAITAPHCMIFALLCITPCCGRYHRQVHNQVALLPWSIVM